MTRSPSTNSPEAALANDEPLRWGGLSPGHLGLSVLETIGPGGARRNISFLFGFVSRTYREAGWCGLHYLPSVLTVRLSALSPGMISAATQMGRRDQTRRRKRGSSEFGVQPVHMLPLVRLLPHNKFPTPVSSYTFLLSLPRHLLTSKARLDKARLISFVSFTRLIPGRSCALQTCLSGQPIPYTQDAFLNVNYP